MSIRQLNASYVAEEDRVMFRFTTAQNEEYRLWLTRAVLSVLMQQTRALAVKKLAHDHSVQQAKEVAQFNQQALQQAVSYTQFEGATRLPLGAEPVLVKGVQASVQDAAAVLVLQLSRGQILSLKLGDDLLGKLELLLDKMNVAARWALPADAVSLKPEATGVDADGQTADERAAIPPGSKVLH
jgi:hypothetical protein